MERKPEFNQGEFVSLRGNPRIHLQIVEVHSVTCNAGTQFSYSGRVWKDEALGWGRALAQRVCTFGKNEPFHESEVMPLVAAKNDVETMLREAQSAAIDSGDLKLAATILDLIRQRDQAEATS